MNLATALKLAIPPAADEAPELSVSALIRDGGGTPLALAEAMLCPGAYTAVANVSGVAAFYDIPDGNYTLKAVDAGHTVYGTTAVTVSSGTPAAPTLNIFDPYIALAC